MNVVLTVRLKQILAALLESNEPAVLQFAQGITESPEGGWRIDDYRERLRAFAQFLHGGRPDVATVERCFCVYSGGAKSKLLFKADHPETLLYLENIDPSLKYAYPADVKAWREEYTQKATEVLDRVRRLNLEVQP